MKKILLLSVLAVANIIAFAQSSDSLANRYSNSATSLLEKDSKLVIGGYGEVHYNQPLESGVKHNGDLDVHRVVLLFGYNFTDKIQFVSELEIEHVKEVYIEQAFLQYKLNDYINFRGGLMLVPMGIINEYHEPTTFNGVERPLVDKYISPTTWREIGFGATGNILPASIKYQAYVMNGFNGYDGSAKLSGENGLRKGRQKGAESYISSANFSGKVEYYGVRGLNIGLSGYYGKTQSTLYDGISKSDNAAMATADSSVVGVSMVGLDTRYRYQALQLRGQLYYSKLSNTEQYNTFTADSDGNLNDVGNSMIGYYGEVGYDILNFVNTEKQLVPFIRYEYFNTHNSVDNNITLNKGYGKRVITTGLTLALTKGAVIKTDIQFINADGSNKYSQVFNAGVGVMF